MPHRNVKELDVHLAHLAHLRDVVLALQVIGGDAAAALELGDRVGAEDLGLVPLAVDLRLAIHHTAVTHVLRADLHLYQLGRRPEAYILPVPSQRFLRCLQEKGEMGGEKEVGDE